MGRGGGSTLRSVPEFARRHLIHFIVLSLSAIALIGDAGIRSAWSAPTSILFYANALVSAAFLVFAVKYRRTGFVGIFYFMFVFYFVALAVQLRFRWDIMFYDDGVMRTALGITLLFQTIIAAFMVWRRKTIGGARQASAHVRVLRSTRQLVSILIVMLGVDLVLVYLFGPALFSYVEDFAHELSTELGGQLYLVMRIFALPFLLIFPTMCVLVFYRRGARGPLMLGLLLVAFGLVFNNPRITSRFLLSTLLIGAMTLAMGPRRSLVLFLILLAGNYVSPLFHAFRAEHFSSRAPGVETFLTFDYDSASVLAHGIAYVGERGVTYGANLVSALLFFVPDEIWAGKLDTTGVILRDLFILEYRFTPTRTATPLFLEGYVAFLWPGVVLVAVCLGYCARWLDQDNVSDEVLDRVISVRTALLSYTPVLIVLLCRGTLMSAFAYFCGVSLAVVIAVILLRRRTGTAQPMPTFHSNQPWVAGGAGR